MRPFISRVLKRCADYTLCVMAQNDFMCFVARHFYSLMQTRDACETNNASVNNGMALNILAKE